MQCHSTQSHIFISGNGLGYNTATQLLIVFSFITIYFGSLASYWKFNIYNLFLTSHCKQDRQVPVLTTGSTCSKFFGSTAHETIHYFYYVHIDVCVIFYCCERKNISNFRLLLRIQMTIYLPFPILLWHNQLPSQPHYNCFPPTALWYCLDQFLCV